MKGGGMLRFVLQRSVFMLGMLFALLVLTFVISHIAPGDPAALAAGPDATKEMIETVRKEYGLDKSLPVQFWIYAGGILQGDFGSSIFSGREVVDDLILYFPATFELVLFSIIFSVLLGVPLGVLSAVKQNTWIDHVIRIFSVSGVGVPMFWLGLMLQLYFALHLGWLPLGSQLEIMTDPPEPITHLLVFDSLLRMQFDITLEALHHMVLPALTLCFPALASIARVNRAEMLETLNEDYITNAQAQGISTFRIVGLYALRNAMLPTLAMIGLRFGWMLGGTILVESVFDWPGVGLYAVQTAVSSDFEPIMAVTLLLGFFFMLANFIVDILYNLLDPRLQEIGQ
jgi:peptide/nickel transport system permease protein